MPNPFIKAGPMKTSTEPDDHGRVDPVPENYEGDNHPYRGTESHGVADTVDPAPINGYEATLAGVTYVKTVDEQEPIPVVVKNRTTKETIDWRVHNWSFMDDLPQRILPKNENRISARIRNSGNEVIYINHNGSVVPFLGYTLNAANPVLDIHHRQEVWAIRAPGGVPGAIEIHEEFSVTLED